MKSLASMQINVETACGACPVYILRRAQSRGPPMHKGVNFGRLPLPDSCASFLPLHFFCPHYYCDAADAWLGLLFARFRDDFGESDLCSSFLFSFLFGSISGIFRRDLLGFGNDRVYKFIFTNLAQILMAWQSCNEKIYRDMNHFLMTRRVHCKLLTYQETTFCKKMCWQNEKS